MRAEELQGNPLVSTAAVSAAMRDPETADYIQLCLDKFFSGLYGQISEADGAANDEELRTGEGRIFAKYEAEGKLSEAIYIIAYFSQSNQGDPDYNNTTILYQSEY